MIDSWRPADVPNPLRVSFISDLHLLADRSLGPDADPIIAQSLRDVDLCVWGGDLFDFRWTRQPMQPSVDWAIDWLGRWAEEYPDVRFLYLFGNHDVHEPFREAIDRFAAGHDAYETPRQIVRIGDTMMLHGDAMIGHRVAGRFDDYRRSWAARRPAPAWQNRWYAAAVTLRLHRAAAAAGHRNRITCEHLHRYLQRHDPGGWRRTGRVVFGHTHRRLAGYRHRGRSYYNPGAGIRHVPFAPVRLEVDQTAERREPPGDA